MFSTHKFFLLIFSLLLVSACNRSTEPATDSVAPAPTEPQVEVVVPIETPRPTSTPIPTSAPTATLVPTQTPEEVTTEDDVTAVDNAAADVTDTEEDATTVDDTADKAGDEVAEAVAATAETEIPYTGRPPEQLWAELACSACHQIDKDQTEDDSGPVGPHQGNLAERIAVIAPDQSAEEYVYTSIVDPNAFVVEPYFPNIMPQTYSEQMSEAEIRQLVQWLLDPNR